MLFDLKGRRRRVVQVTYVGLALLMGGGLVLSGIGSDASGGLLDALIGSDSGGNTSDVKKPFENQIKAAEQALRANPRDQAALATLVRAHFALAGTEQQQNENGQVAYTDRGIAELNAADAAWARYLASDPKQIDRDLAFTAFQLYNVLGPPKDPRDREKYLRPAQEIAAQTDTADGYISLFTVATKAGDTRTAALAERKALSYAQSKEERATIKERIQREKAALAAAGSGSAGANGAAPSGP
jgi:hypothetical protein